MLEKGQLSGSKIENLIELKEIVDRFATVSYVSDSEIQDFQSRYGQSPDIMSWGDFFQTEVASRYFTLNDEEFSVIIDTIRFDLISACLIFRKKDQDFFDAVVEEALLAGRKGPEEWTDKDEQAVHLGILKRYFEHMGLSRTEIPAADLRWFDGFVRQAEVS